METSAQTGRPFSFSEFFLMVIRGPVRVGKVLFYVIRAPASESRGSWSEKDNRPKCMCWAAIVNECVWRNLLNPQQIHRAHFFCIRADVYRLPQRGDRAALNKRHGHVKTGPP